MKKIATCPTCQRDVNDVDDVKEVGGVVYHEECAPEATPQTVANQPEPVVNLARKDKKMKKVDPRDEMMEKLLSAVASLTEQVAELKARPAQTVTVARSSKPKSERGAPRPMVYYVLKGYPTEKRPPQCLRVMRALAQAAPEGGRMTEMDVWNALMDGEFPSTKANPKLGAWNYAQTPFYIFKYYRAGMIDAEYIAGPFDVV